MLFGLGHPENEFKTSESYRKYYRHAMLVNLELLEDFCWIEGGKAQELGRNPASLKNHVVSNLEGRQNATEKENTKYLGSEKLRPSKVGLKGQGARGSKNILNELKSPQRLAGHVRPNSSRAELKRTSEGRPQESAILLVRWSTLKLLEFAGKRWGAGPGWEFQVVDRREACAQGLYGQLEDTGPECSWGPEGRSPRLPSRLPGPRPNPAAHPSAQRSLAWPAPGGEGKLGRVPPSAPRGPQSSRQAASSTRRQTPGRPIPPRRLGAAPSSTCAGHCPPRAPGAWRGAVSPAAEPDGAGRFCYLQLLRGVSAGGRPQ